MVAAACKPIQRVDQFERERRLCCRHLTEVAFSLLQHILHGSIALLCDICDQVPKVRICEHLAGQDAGDFVTRTTENALRAFQSDERLVGCELCERIVIDGRPGLSLTQFIEPGAIADDTGEPFRPVFCEPPPPCLAGFRDAPVKKIQQRSILAPGRCGQPGDSQGLQPDRVALVRKCSQPAVRAAPG